MIEHSAMFRFTQDDPDFMFKVRFQGTLTHWYTHIHTYTFINYIFDGKIQLLLMIYFIWSYPNHLDIH